MPVDAVIRVSFQTSVQANQAANTALVGHAQNAAGQGPFQRVGTAAYSCSNAPERDVAQSLAALANAILNHAAQLDFVSISIVRRGEAHGVAAPAAV